MTDESKNKTLVESSSIAEGVAGPPPELATETTTLVAPLSELEAEAPSEDSDQSPSSKERQTKGFDPYRFQVMTVPPGLRSEMAQVKLPRLAHEYFKETLPPPTMKAAADDPITPSDEPKVRTMPLKVPSDAPTVFEPSERTPTSLAVPMASTPRTVLWGALGLLVGVILLFVAREFMEEEPSLTVPPPEVPKTAPLLTAAPELTTAVASAEPAHTDLATNLPPPSPIEAERPSAPSASAASAPPREPRQPSGLTAPSSQGQGSAQNTKRLWITPR